MNNLMRHYSRRAGAVVLLLTLLDLTGVLGAESEVSKRSSVVIDYELPKLLVGNIFLMGPEPKKILYKSERKAVREGASVKVTCEYTAVDGAIVACDRIVYGNGRLASIVSDQLQKGQKGSAVFRDDPSHPGQRTISFEFTATPSGDVQKSSESERADMETLVDDMIPGFIATHWDALAGGATAKFRYIVLDRLETVGFKLVKQSETTWQGKPVLRIKMEPTSFIIAQLVDPLYFVVEKAAPHRTFQYLGRTTPVIKDGKRWKDLDADTVFEWK